VDHFIPWSRYPADLGHNFVLAHDRCINAKSDYLAAYSLAGPKPPTIADGDKDGTPWGSEPRVWWDGVMKTIQLTPQQRKVAVVKQSGPT
jgi:hypothetical protein